MRQLVLRSPKPSRRLRSVAVCFGLAPLLGGCLLTKEPPPVGIDMPKAYRAGPRNADIRLPSVVWWRGFHSKTLTNLIEEALTSNLDIAIAVARIEQADAQSRITGAALLPNIGLNASATRSRASQGTGSIALSSGSERTSYSTTLNASYTIDLWGQNRARLRAAEEGAAASRFDREVVALTTVATVANVYFQALSANDRLRVARDNLTAAERVLKLIQARVSAGTASELDTAQQESLVNTQRAAIPPLEQVVQQNMATLAVLTGRTPERGVMPVGGMSRIGIPRVTPGLPSDLLGQRPDVREAEARLEAANANVYAARAAFLPTISLTGEGGYQSNALQMLLRPESALFNLAANLTQPIFDGGLLQGQLDQQTGLQDELLQTYRRSIISAFGDVENALVAVRQTARREQLQNDVVRSSRRAFELSESRLREGTIDLVTVLSAQQTLFQAQDLQAQARLARLLAVVSLFQALGGGWQLPPEKPPAAL
jgi:multidrug efflux system outer membrane protein